MKVGFLGLGLIGGSIARALKQHKDKYQIFFYDIYTIMASDCIKSAMAEGILDCACSCIDELTDCDVIFLCAPVSVNIQYLKELSSKIKPDCILTDVGSVKSSIHAASKECSLDSCFIGGHPMAGSEKSGFENASAHLLENAYYILTPTVQTPSDKIDRMKSIIVDINAIPMILGVQEHDDITAVISHLPHIIAAQLVNLVKSCDDDMQKMRILAAGGFKDITRIASSSPVMWQNICLNNKKSIRWVLNKYIQSLQQFLQAIDFQQSDYLLHSFEEALEYRSNIPNSKGMINRIFELYIDITDEPGAIAIIATLLGSNGISIKNIGIIHNREFEEGVLRIEFYEEAAIKKANKLLTSHNYNIYARD